MENDNTERKLVPVGWSGVVPDFTAYKVSFHTSGGGKPNHYHAANFGDGPKLEMINRRWVRVITVETDLWLSFNPGEEQIVRGVCVQDNSKFQFFIPQENIPAELMSPE